MRLLLLRRFGAQPEQSFCAWVTGRARLTIPLSIIQRWCVRPWLSGALLGRFCWYVWWWQVSKIWVCTQGWLRRVVSITALWGRLSQSIFYSSLATLEYLLHHLIQAIRPWSASQHRLAISGEDRSQWHFHHGAGRHGSISGCWLTTHRLILKGWRAEGLRLWHTRLCYSWELYEN